MEDNMLHIVKDSPKAETTEIYRLGRSIKNDDGSIAGYTDCVKIIEFNGKRLAYPGTWIPVGLVVRKYGIKDDSERKSAYLYNEELDKLIVIAAERKAAWDKYYLDH